MIICMWLVESLVVQYVTAVPALLEQAKEAVGEEKVIPAITTLPAVNAAVAVAVKLIFNRQSPL